MHNLGDVYGVSPIGVFDSGVGGISVLHHIHALLPSENILYLADSLHAPYGSKTPEEIWERSVACTEMLLDRGARAIVVACNTATAVAVSRLRAAYSVPIIGMEPAVKPAVAATRSGVVGVLATVGTLQSARFAALLENYGGRVKIVTQGCPGLVELIESAHLDSRETLALLDQYLQPLLRAGADTIVLGCTHYPFVNPAIQQLAGPGVILVDTGAAVARQVLRRLAEANILTPEENYGQVTFLTNSPGEHAEEIILALWGKTAPVHRIESPGSL